MGFLAPVIGAVAGGLLGGNDGGGSQTQSKEPWEPARKPLINSLNTGQDLERYYQKNPFNQMQRQGYQNLFSDLDMLRNQIAPGMMQFANQMMGSDYQRGPRNSQREAMGGGGGYGGDMGGYGGMQTNMKQPMMMNQGGDGVYSTKPMQMPQGGAGGQAGLLSMGGGGPFPMPSGGSYGLLDFVELNPFTSTTNGIPKPPVEKPPEKTPDDLAREEWERRRISGEGYRGEGA
jgi:hypothetical protein